MPELSLVAALCLLGACFLTGFSKASVGGMGLISVPLLVLGFGPKAAIGVFLPILLVADVWNVWLYRGLCRWSLLWGFLPSCVLGVVLGFALLDHLSEAWITLLIGVIILCMLAISLLAPRWQGIFGSAHFTRGVGTLAGISSMLAHSAGSLVGMHFLQQGLQKRVYISTRNHFYLFLNALKLPFAVQLGVISSQTLVLDLVFVPAMFLGSWVGLWLVKRIDLVTVKRVVQVAALLSGAKLVASAPVWGV